MIDSITFHPYGVSTGRPLVDTYKFWRQVLAEHQPDQTLSPPPIACGEMGFRLTDQEGASDEAEGHAFANLLLTNAIAGVQLTIFYEFVDRILPTPRLRTKATCYMGMVYMPYNKTAAAAKLAPLRLKVRGLFGAHEINSVM